MGPGERFTVGRFSLELRNVREEEHANYGAVQAQVILRSLKDDSILETLRPELRFYPKNKETTTEVALRMGQREDVYLVLAGIDESGTRASLKLFINPLQVWLWYGAILMIIGGIVVAVPVPRQAMAKQREKERGLQSI